MKHRMCIIIPHLNYLWQAWVELDSRDEMERALDLHRKHLGSRLT